MHSSLTVPGVHSPTAEKTGKKATNLLEARSKGSVSEAAATLLDFYMRWKKTRTGVE